MMFRSLRFPRRSPFARRGLTLFELIVALFVMTTAMMILVQLLAVVAGQRRQLDQRRAAATEVANQAERLALLPWNDFVSTETSTWDLSEQFRQALPQATAKIEVQEEAEPVAARRIRLMVMSPNAAGQLIELADLTVWKFNPASQVQPEAVP